jgi:hypothetical protein
MPLAIKVNHPEEKYSNIQSTLFNKKAGRLENRLLVTLTVHMRKLF